MASRTPLFSFETPDRRHGSSRNGRNPSARPSAREVLRQIVPPNASVGSPVSEPATEDCNATPSRNGSSDHDRSIAAVTTTPQYRERSTFATISTEEERIK